MPPLNGPVSFVKACKHYFDMQGTEMIADFRKLSHTDKSELREELIRVGYEVDPLGEPVVEAPALVGV
jgi:hypothetical protein